MSLVPLWVGALVLTVLHLSNAENIVTLDPDSSPINVVDPKFLSITFDSSGLIYDPEYVLDTDILYKFKNEKLRKLVKHLSPAFFRVGGTLADAIIYYPSDGAQEDYPNAQYAYPINETHLLDLINATNAMDVDLIFCLDGGIMRYDNGSWDSRNAEEIISFFDDRNLRVSWQLGNEPDLYVESSTTPNIKTFNGTQMGKDILVLKEILSNTKNYKDALLVGPDILRIAQNGQGNPYLRDILAVAGTALDAITWHHYYFAGSTATVSQFTDPSIFSALESDINAGLQIVTDLNLQDTPAWLGETSSGWGGGSANLSDRYASTFIWLDKLGLSAKLGLKAVVRQTIITGGYTLIDTNTDENNPFPNPDWWVSIMFKRVVGTKVLPLTTSTNSTVRLYAHCSTEEFNPGSVTVYGVNLENATATVNLQGVSGNVHAFELTSGSESSLLSKQILLNGNVLNVSEDYDLPELEANIVSQPSSLTMPPYSNVFWVIPDAQVNACM